VTAAFWSAVAATAAAVSSLLTYFVHRRNMLEAARPELLLDEWTLERNEKVTGVATFGSIRNVGRGAAMHTTIVATRAPGAEPDAAVGLDHVAIIPPGEAVSVDGQVVLFWNNATASRPGRVLPFTIKVLSWDSRSMRHETDYRLLAMRPAEHVAGAMELAPGLHLLRRTTRSTSVRRLKATRRVKRALRAVRKALTVLSTGMRSRALPSASDSERGEDPEARARVTFPGDR
jgi:hypothetical protein